MRHFWKFQTLCIRSLEHVLVFVCMIADKFWNEGNHNYYNTSSVVVGARYFAVVFWLLQWNNCLRKKTVNAITRDLFKIKFLKEMPKDKQEKKRDKKIHR